MAPRLFPTAAFPTTIFNFNFSFLCFPGSPVICVNLAERSGREKIISDAYLVSFLSPSFALGRVAQTSILPLLKIEWALVQNSAAELANA